MDPIILLHGFLLDNRMWHAQATFLRAAGHTVLTPDFPGCGLHPNLPAPTPQNASIEAFADHIHQLIETHTGGRAIVAGFSMGGYVLLALLRAHPADVSAAIFIDTRAEADAPDARAVRLASIEDVKLNGTAKLVDTMTTRLLRKSPDPAVKDTVRKHMADQSPEIVIASQTAMANRRDQTDLLPTLKIPTLIIVGEEDIITPPAVAQTIHRNIPQAKIKQIPNAGHMTPMEQPAPVNSALADFLATLSS